MLSLMYALRQSKVMIQYFYLSSCSLQTKQRCFYSAFCYFFTAFVLCLHCTSQPLKVLNAVIKYCFAFLLDFTKTLLTTLTEDRGTALRNTDMPQLRDQCLQVTNFTTRTKSTGNDDENTISQHISYANLFSYSCLVMG